MGVLNPVQASKTFKKLGLANSKLGCEIREKIAPCLSRVIGETPAQPLGDRDPNTLNGEGVVVH